MPKCDTQFKRGNPGRPKGSRNKLSEDFFKALHNDFQAHGKATIEAARESDPVAYVRMIASLLPKDVRINERPLVEWTDAEIMAKLDEFDAKHGDGADDDTGQIH